MLKMLSGDVWLGLVTVEMKLFRRSKQLLILRVEIGCSQQLICTRSVFRAEDVSFLPMAACWTVTSRFDCASSFCSSPFYFKDPPIRLWCAASSFRVAAHAPT